MRATLVLVGLVLTAGAAAAAPGSLEITTPDETHVSGRVVAEAVGGSLDVTDPEASGLRVLRNATGTVTVWTWTQARAHAQSPIQGVSNVTLVRRLSDAESATYRVVGSDLVLAYDGEPFQMHAVAHEGGVVRLAGQAAGAGRPLWLAEAAESQVRPGVDVDVPRRAGEVPWRWERGWMFLGDLWTNGRQHVGFPFLHDAVADLEGAFAVQVDGGVASFVDAEGVVHEFRLGNRPDPAVPGGVQQEWSRLVFEGTLDGADAALGHRWGAAAPEVRWTLEGETAWTRATGHLEVDGRRTTFSHEAVALTGEFRTAPVAPRGLALVGSPDTYRADGEFSSFLLRGRDAAAPSRTVDPAVAATFVAVAVAAAAALWTFFGPFYTRIAPGRALDHPARRRLHDVVLAEPGIHTRELHRRLGGAWGPFTFHLRVLANAGFVRVERQGRYRLVLPTQTLPAGPAIPSPVARSVYATIPADGAAIRYGDLRARLGISSQLLYYHLRSLEARGLVVSAREGRQRMLRRANSARGGPRDERSTTSS